MKTIRISSICLLIAAACSTPPQLPGDGGSVDSGTTDSGPVDSGTMEVPDSGTPGAPLQLFSITPTSGMAGDQFVIAGQGIAPQAVVEFGTNAVTDAQVSLDGTSISGTVPINSSGSSTVTVNVTNGPGIIASVPQQFTYGSDSITWCKLYPPTSVEVVAGAQTPMLAAEVRPASIVGASGINEPAGEVGYGDPSANPATWAWNAAVASTMTDGANGIYNGLLTPPRAGKYAFAFRFTLDGVNYVYCDSNGSSTGADGGSTFNVNAAGTLIVDTPPTVTGLMPGSGVPGDMVTITGTGLTSNAQVSFGSAIATVDVVDPSGTLLTVTVPQGSGMVSVTVTEGGETLTVPTPFTYDMLPTYCVVDPPTMVTIVAGQTSPDLYGRVYAPGVTDTASDGTGISGQIGVADASAMPIIWTWSDAAYSMKGGTSGHDDVFAAQVTSDTPGSYLYAFRFSLDGTNFLYCDTQGPQPATALATPGALTVLPAPTITDVAPPSGTAGTLVTITGTGFAAGMSFNFGSAAATNVQITSATTATATVPAGSGSVAVTGVLDGYTTAAWTGMFVYQASVGWCRLDSPATATVVAGQTTPSLYGEVYDMGLTDVVGNGGTGIVAEVGYGDPAATPDQWSWSVASFSGYTDGNGGTTGNNDAFFGTLTPTMAGTFAYAFRFSVDGVTYTYCDQTGPVGDVAPTMPGTLDVLPAPTITGVSPASAPAGATVTITGTGFQNGVAFAFGGASATTVSVATDGSSAQVTVPPGSGMVAVTATLLNDTAQWSNSFTYLATPQITGVSPAIAAAGSTVTITGTGLGSGTTFAFGAVAATVVGTPTDTSAQVTVPAGSGSVNVTATLDGISAQWSKQFTYLAITSVTPAAGPAGTTVTITGTGFTSGIAFSFGGTAASIVGTPSSTSAQVTVPAPTGGTSVSVAATLNGSTAIWSGQYTYTASPPPVISSFSPAFLPIAGGALTINGSGFNPSSLSVTIGGQPATLEGFPSATQIGVAAPALGPGPQTVVVTSNGVASTGVAIPYALKFSVAVDGNLSDWPSAALVGSSSTTSEWGSNNTLNQLYLGYDDTNLYVGIQGQVQYDSSQNIDNAIVGYLSMGGLTDGVSEIDHVLQDADSNDYLGYNLSSGFIVNSADTMSAYSPVGQQWQYGFGILSSQSGQNITSTVNFYEGVRQFTTSNMATNMYWPNATVASQSLNGTSGGAAELAIPWGAAGVNIDTTTSFAPFPSGSLNPMTISAFVRIVGCSGTCFPNQSLPGDANLQTGNVALQRATVSAVSTIQIY